MSAQTRSPTCAVCGAHANEHWAISHAYIGPEPLKTPDWAIYYSNGLHNTYDIARMSAESPNIWPVPVVLASHHEMIRGDLAALQAQSAEMVKTLRKFVEIMDSGEDGGEGVFEDRMERLLPEARAAILKATGVRP